MGWTVRFARLLLPENSLAPSDRFAIKTLISPTYASHHRNRHRRRDTLFLRPGRVAADFDERMADDPVSAFEELQKEGRFWWDSTGGDGAYLFHFYVDADMPEEIRRHSHDPLEMARLAVPSGTIWACGASQDFSSPATSRPSRRGRVGRRDMPVLAALVLTLSVCPSLAAKGASSSAPFVAQQAQQAQAQKVTKYTLPPDSHKKARDLSRIRFAGTLIGFFYGLAVLWLILRWKLSAKYRTWAETAFSRRFLQAIVFAPPLILTIDILELPLAAAQNWILRTYGISVQGWGSWFWDWTKGEIISIIISTILVWILYAAIRKAPRRWWFYFWLAALPIGLLVFFLNPLIIDPLFHKFEPLAKKDAPLTASLEAMVQRAGENIPPERMFWMGAAEKTTALNAYVTGFGASKRIVVWDTTIAKMNTPQIVFVGGHEMGHYVLRHIPKGLAFGAAFLFVFFYLGFRSIGSVLARWGGNWGVHGVDDWASLPALVLLLSVFFALALPVFNAYSRHYEHQADQYALEVTHGLTPDSGQAGAQTFQILGEVNLSDPEPNPVAVFLYYDHPAIPDRIQFCLTYDPWSKGQPPEFVK